MDFRSVLPSAYRGIRFRSRTEARWAIYFEALGVPWEYEVEGFALPSGNYVPDFLLPPRDKAPARWVEIKNGPVTEIDQRLARELAELTGLAVVTFVGPPITSRDAGMEWCPGGSYAEPVGIEVESAASKRAAEFSANARWDGGDEPTLPPTPTQTSPGVTDVPFATRLAEHARRTEWERLIGAAIFAPQHFQDIQADLRPEEILDPALRTIWTAAIEARGQSSLNAQSVADAIASDPMALAAFCGLPTEIPGDSFDRWVPDALRARAARRARLSAVLKVFAPEKGGA